MEIICEKGERIYLTDVRSQTFLGVVKSVNTQLGRLLLSDVVQLPEHKSISGYRNFDKNEIKAIKKFEPEAAGAVQNNVSKDPDNLEIHPSDSPEKIAESPVRLIEPDVKLPESVQEEIKKLQTEYCYIRDFGTNFHSSICLLKSCPKIGVYAKVSSKGRFKRASVLAISTPSNIFVFDLRVLGDDVLQKGLKEILESQDIVKVVHDSRFLSDCFKHKHLINLENIRDVEAEDIMVVFQERRFIRRHSRSLEYLIRVYLGVKLDVRDETEEAWDERPLETKLLEELVSFASFLIPLQEAVERKYIQRLINASNIYNNHVRDLDFFDMMYNEPKKTLRKELSKLVVPQNQVRGECKLKRISTT